MNVICSQIETDLKDQIEMFEAEGQKLEAKRLKERTEFDIEMIKELGSCFGIENYSRYIDQRQPGQRPNCLLDYFPEDYLMVIDESHVTIPQIHAMYGGNYSMKKNLVEYGFRLAAAFDNRPLKFNEFEECINQAIFVSATPADYEFRQSEGVIVEQLIRPTGVVDPTIEVRPTKNQIDELIDEIDKTITNGNRVLITTLTKRMAEELDEYLRKINLNTAYIHSAVKPIDRVEIIEKLKDGTVDVLVGVNLLREGLDLPEVELVVIFDADKEGFLRNTRSMIQTIGRAARNIEGRVILFADKHTDSMKRAIDETNRRRKIQIEYNKANNIIPQTIKNKTEIKLTNKLSEKQKKQQSLKLLEDIIKNADKKELKQMISKTKKEMEEAAKNLDFLVAAKLRDEWEFLKNTLKNQK
jgi:excinuclease ABC subunit B